MNQFTFENKNRRMNLLEDHKVLHILDYGIIPYMLGQHVSKDPLHSVKHTNYININSCFYTSFKPELYELLKLMDSTCNVDCFIFFSRL